MLDLQHVYLHLCPTPKENGRVTKIVNIQPFERKTWAMANGIHETAQKDILMLEKKGRETDLVEGAEHI